MNFYSIGDFREDARKICAKIRNTGSEEVITLNGKPTLLVMEITAENFETVLRAVKQAKAMIAYNTMKASAAEHGYMKKTEIGEEIKAVREEGRDKV